MKNIEKYPKYLFPKDEFSTSKDLIIIDKERHKRYKLEVVFNGKRGNESWLVILKNPSRAGENDINESDKTINTVGRYFFKNKTEVQRLVIVNLFPVYQTYPKELQKREIDLLDTINKKIIKEEIENAHGIVIAWGTHPSGCKNAFNAMKQFVHPLLINKSCYQMGKLKENDFKINKERPLHGQVWGYDKTNYILKKIIHKSNLGI